jgi:hypothetical protein
LGNIKCNDDQEETLRRERTGGDGIEDQGQCYALPLLSSLSPSFKLQQKRKEEEEDRLKKNQVDNTIDDPPPTDADLVAE